MGDLSDGNPVSGWCDEGFGAPGWPTRVALPPVRRPEPGADDLIRQQQQQQQQQQQ